MVFLDVRSSKDVQDNTIYIHRGTGYILFKRHNSSVHIRANIAI